MRAFATGQGQLPGEMAGGTEKRAYPRDPARDLSEIILDSSKHGVACLIHDLSDGGAKLEVSCGELPKRFILANYTKRTRTVCKLIWRDGNMIGVSFLTRPRQFNFDSRS